jgi:ribA/ribD-fused uncharacterized protein
VGFFGSQNPQLSNHAIVPFTYKGQRYLSSEHAYLAEQATSYGLMDLAMLWQAANSRERYQGEVYDTSNPKRVKAWSTKAFRPFRVPTHPATKIARRRWESRRLNAMFSINMAKARQSTRFREDLFATGNAYLVEVSRSDGFWGIGYQPSPQELQGGPLTRDSRWGQNRLGMILMAVRNILRIRAKTIKRANKRSGLHKATLAAKALASTGGSTHGPTDKAVEMMAHFSMQLCPGVWQKQVMRAKTVWESTGGRIMPVRRDARALRPYWEVRAEASEAFARRMMATENKRRKQRNMKPLTL